MDISFLGGAQTVTGSKYLVKNGQTQILVDCGLFQGLKSLRLLNWDTFPFDPRDIQAVVLTHAHLDHCGALPLLIKNGFSGPIYCTPPTLELTKIILLDSAKIQEEEAEYANKRHFSKHHPALPLYTVDDVEKVFSSFKPVEYKSEFSIGSLRIKLFSSGHILGAASALVESPEKSVYFSGDLGRNNDPLMWPPEPPPAVDAIVMESTYGNRIHSPVPSKKVLQDCITEVTKNNGVLLIPSFSVGRAQNLLLEIVELKKEGLIQESIPIYINTPMGQAASKLYAEFDKFHRLGPGDFEEMMTEVHEVRDAADSIRLNESSERPLIIVAASGMLTGGRVLHHLKAFGANPRNTLLLAGFQAVGTRGRDLLDGKKELKIHGAMRDILCKVVPSDSFSAHADQVELLAWLKSSPKQPSRIFIVHGEPEAQNELAEKILQEFRIQSEIPTMNQNIRL